MQDILHEMERKGHCRFERGGQGSGRQAFPVTHILEGGLIRYAHGADSGRLTRYAHISIPNGELLNWCIMDPAGYVMIHGCERNLSGTRAGYILMIRRALRHLQSYGARRVYPRDRTHRKGPARNTVSLHGWAR